MNGMARWEYWEQDVRFADEPGVVCLAEQS
jgi:hypothetical protein